VPANAIAVKVNPPGYPAVESLPYLVLLPVPQGRPSGSERIKFPFSSQPLAGRFTALERLGEAMSSSNRNRLISRIPTKGTATRKFPQPDCRMTSCTTYSRIHYRCVVAEVSNLSVNVDIVQY